MEAIVDFFVTDLVKTGILLGGFIIMGNIKNRFNIRGDEAFEDYVKRAYSADIARRGLFRLVKLPGGVTTKVKYTQARFIVDMLKAGIEKSNQKAG